MKRAESKNRVFLIGMAAAVVIALAGLGACDTTLATEDLTPPSGVVDANGKVAVRVNLPKTAAGRSVTDEQVPVYINYYEVIFRVHGQDVYYFASVDAGEGYLSISVDPDVAYDILLLAGQKSRRVLLATGFVNNADGDGYASNGSGYTVKAGQSNVISLNMTKTNLTPDGDGAADITFTGTNVDYVYARTEGLATVTGTVGGNDPTLVVHLKTTKLQNLINAGLPTSNPPLSPFASNKVLLSQRYDQEKEKIFPQEESGSFGANEYTYTFDSGIPGQTVNVDGHLLLELTYYAFGDPTSKSSKWNIRNGLGYAEDNTGSGGRIVVKFGEGTKFQEGVIIET